MRGRAAGPGKAGFTLLEMLLAAALLSLLLGALGASEVQSRRARAAGEAAVEKAQLVELAGEVLAYHLRLAGYRGTASPVDLGGPALQVERGAGAGDRLTVRYLEDRWLAAPAVRALRLEVGIDSQGRGNLYLQEVGATRQPAVLGVTSLRVVRYLLPGGGEATAGTPLPLVAAAVELELGFEWGETRRLVAAFGAPRRIEEGP